MERGETTSEGGREAPSPVHRVDSMTRRRLKAVVLVEGLDRPRQEGACASVDGVAVDMPMIS